MSQRRPNPCAQLDKLIPAYVLGSLEAEEQDWVLRQLPRCPQSRRRVDELRRVVEALPYAIAPQTASPALKARLLARLEREEQGGRANLGERLFGWAGRLAPLGAAALLLFLGVLVGWNLSIQGELARQRDLVEVLFNRLREQELALAFLTTGQYSRISLQGQGAASEAWGLLMVDPQERVAMLLAYDLPTLRPEQAYQLWLIQDNRRDSGGLLSIDASGRGYLWIRAPAPLGVYQGVGVTLEPEQGSLEPTGPRVLAASL